jgi:hypothetical protein
MKTAIELGIEQWELDALLETRDFLIKFNPQTPDNIDSHCGLPDAEGPTKFCMDYGVQEFDCGTAMCIGGFVKLIQMEIPVGDVAPMDYVQARTIEDYVLSIGHEHALRDLYYPPSVVAYDSITAEHAAIAITNYLEEGDPAWLTINGIELKEEEE